MTPRVRMIVGAAGVAVGLLGAAAFVWGGYPTSTNDLVLAVTLTIAVGWSFVFVGLAATTARPDSRIGVLMVVAGFAALARPVGAIDTSAAYLVGLAVEGAVYGVVAHLLVSFPTGRLRTRGERAATAFWYFLTIPLDLFIFLLGNTGEVGCGSCRSNLAVPRVLDGEVDVGERGFQPIVIVACLLVLWLLHRRWARSSPALQRSLAPSLLGGALLLLVIIAQRIGLIVSAPTAARMTLAWASYVALAFFPLGLLTGLIRGRMDRSAVADLAVAVTGAPGPQGLREALARALHDPSLQVAYWLEEQQVFVDDRGAPVQVAGRDPRSTTVLQRDGEPVAALLHDETVAEQRELLEAVAATAGLAIENERLHAAVRAQLAEVHASRARIVAAGDAERRRVERNLHDGAQQSLLSVLLTLRLIRAQLDSRDYDAADATLDDACHALSGAIEEVRELARGIHPAVLSDAGLAPALHSLAERSTIPVTVTGVPTERLSPVVEETVYFLVAESLANVARHARAHQAGVEVHHLDGLLTVEIHDDGIGGVDDKDGSGLRGLGDRVAAVGGRLEVHSATGGGTRVRAELPCA